MSDDWVSSSVEEIPEMNKPPGDGLHGIPFWEVGDILEDP